MLRALLFVADIAAAHQGEWNIDLIVAPEVASAVHPLSAPTTTPLDTEATTIFKPRLGLGMRYNLTSSIYGGISLDVAPSTSVTTNGVTVDDVTGNLLTSTYAEFSAEALVGYKFDSGFPLSGAIELSAAPVAVLWSSNNLVDPLDLDDSGRPARYPIDLTDTWAIGALARMNVLFAARFWDFGVDVGPTVTVAWATTPSVHAGLMLRPTFFWGGAL